MNKLGEAIFANMTLRMTLRVLMAALLACALVAMTAAKRPNIVFIMSDGGLKLAWALGCDGGGCCCASAAPPGTPPEGNDPQ